MAMTNNGHKEIALPTKYYAKTFGDEIGWKH